VISRRIHILAALVLMVITAAAPPLFSRDIRTLPDFVPSGDELNAASRELFRLSGLSPKSGSAWMVSGPALASLVSKEAGAVVSPPWIGFSGGEGSGSDALWQQLFSELSSVLAADAASSGSGSGLVMFFNGDFPQPGDGEMWSGVRLVAPEPFLEAVGKAPAGKREAMLPVRFTGSGRESISMLKVSVYPLAAAPKSSYSRGEELDLLYSAEGISVRFRGRVESVNEGRGTISLRPLSTLFRDERGIRRFELSSDGSGALTILQGDRQ
jgi:hypothetical protein